jgi:hypothetical protein
MSRRERWLFSRYLKGCRSFLEFGCGGSTVFALERGVPEVFAVESDPSWVARLRAHPVCSAALADGRLSLRHIDLGPVGQWGRPTDRSRAGTWPAYYESAWKEICTQPDLVLIDGCMRVECATAALRHISRATVVLFHDYFSRPRYHSVAALFDCVDRAGDLAVFRKRA